jgi:ferric-dicitrate binding protein FerR (iron transport regulator)
VVTDTEDPKREDDPAIANLLRASGKREQPSSELERHIRAAVHAEWRATVAQRNRLRQRIWIAAAASILLLVSGLWFSQARMVMPGAVVASVERISGGVSAGGPSTAPWLMGNRWQAVRPRQQLRAHEILRTDQDGRVAIRVKAISLRLDHDTRIAFLAPDRIEVLRGAVYVDSGNSRNGSTAANGLSLDTPVGTVRHLGTQYEVRVLSAGTRIKVREGRVELSDDSGLKEQLTAGEQLIVAVDGTHTRGTSAPHGADWSWTGDVAPPMDIEGRRLTQFLRWVARETGRNIVFVDSRAEAEAVAAILHGSVAGLRPDDAFEAVMPTTRLRGRMADGEILIDMPM